MGPKRAAAELSFCAQKSVEPSGTNFQGLEGPEWTKMGPNGPQKFPKNTLKIESLGSSKGSLGRVLGLQWPSRMQRRREGNAWPAPSARSPRSQAQLLHPKRAIRNPLRELKL